MAYKVPYTASLLYTHPQNETEKEHWALGFV